jgi:tripeptidyl-peptidase II
MNRSFFSRRTLRGGQTRALARLLCLLLAPAFHLVAGPGEDPLLSALIPKREIGQPAFLAAHPEADGRGVVIAIFDTGVDPAAAGLQVTSTGERKVLDILDASGSGDVDTTQRARVAEDGTLPGLSGRPLVLPADLADPEREFRLGLKAARDLFPRSAMQRLQSHEAERRRAELSLLRVERERAERGADLAYRKKAPTDRTREEQDRAAREELLEELEKEALENVPEIHYDCVMWHDGEHWRVIVDTNRDGNLEDEKILRPYRVAGEYAAFDTISNLSFGVQVYEEGDLLSIVTVSGTHGTHVAAIAAAHFPGETARDGVAPGARIVSIRIGDPRTGGSSYGTSERRAVAMAAQAGVDIVNASWGGLSVYQDGQDANSRAYDLLTERYGILTVLSTGNDGPALGTSGSAGGEAHRGLGVGAYVSPEMGRVLYSTLEDKPEAALQFSSRGPTKDGAWGVDILAPGAAVASYSRESLQRVEMANGTSMAAPSAAGGAAVLLSAARAEGLEPGPARLRAALILGARAVTDELIPTQGGGLLNLPGAWEKLLAMREEGAFDAFYDVRVEGGSFAARGRGFHLRERAPKRRHRVVVRVAPGWTEAIPNGTRADFEAGLKLRSTVDWVKVPEYLHLANGESVFIAHVTVPELTAEDLGAVSFGAVEAYLSGRETLGPVFAIPFTIVRGAPYQTFEDEPLEREVRLEPGRIERSFLEVPPGADHLRVTLRHEAEDPIARRFILHGMTVAPELPVYEGGDAEYMRLEEGEERVFDVPTVGGQVLELALYQFWSGMGPGSLRVKLDWRGLGLPGTEISFAPNEGWGQLPLRALRDETVSVEAKLTHGLHVYLPERTRLLSFDERGEFPSSPLRPQAHRQQLVRQVFSLEFEEPLKAQLWYPQSYDDSDHFGGGLTEIYHESGELLFAGRPHRRSSFDLPKGRSTVIRHFDQVRGEGLEDPERWPLVLRRELSSAPGLPVHASLRARFEGEASRRQELRGGAPGQLFLRDGAGEALAKVKPKPDYFQGSVTFKDGLEREVGEVGIRYFAGAVFEDKANQEAKPKPAPPEGNAATRLAEALRERSLEFVRAERGNSDAEVRAERRRILEVLREQRPDDPEPIFEEALAEAMDAGLVGEWWNGPKVETTDLARVEAIEALLAQARSRARPEAVAAFFGATPEPPPGEVEARHAHEREEKAMKALRDQLVAIGQLQVDLARVGGDVAAAWIHFAELARWENKPGKRTRRIEAALHEAEGHLGLALAALNARLEEDPHDASLLRARVALYRELGWERFAVDEEGRLAVRAQGKRRIEALQ